MGRGAYPQFYCRTGGKSSKMHFSLQVYFFQIRTEGNFEEQGLKFLLGKAYPAPCSFWLLLAPPGSYVLLPAPPGSSWFLSLCLSLFLSLSLSHSLSLAH